MTCQDHPTAPAVGYYTTTKGNRRGAGHRLYICAACFNRQLGACLDGSCGADYLDRSGSGCAPTMAYLGMVMRATQYTAL